MLRRFSRLALSLALLPAVALPAAADVVLDWNDVLLNAVRVDRTAPPRASRAMACTHVAIYDAVNGIVGGFAPYAVTTAAPAGASPEAAAAAAAHAMLVDLFPAQKAAFDAALATSLAAIADGAPKTAGIAWGRQVAAAITALRADDGAGATVDYVPPVGSLWWAPTPPAFAVPLLPQWPGVAPWAMKSGSQFRGLPPPAPASTEYLQAYREVFLLGRANSPFRTPEQTEIALFWADGAGTATPPGHWNLIAQELSRQANLTLIENARLFALLGIAMADAAVVAWDHKYTYNFWRPVTAIQNAGNDGNSQTVADPGWLPLIATPPFPAYTSGHSTFSSAAARMLALYAGGDEFDFVTTSDGLPGVTRSFSSFSQAAEEAGQSRIYGGIHWQFDNQLGLSTGNALGEHVFFNALVPVTAPAACLGKPDVLCLGGRFAVEAKWATAGGGRGAGFAVPLGRDSGRFWFFDAENPELVVKVVDACGEFDRFWVFASGLTNVEVTLEVTDTETGRIRLYHNPLNRAFAPVQDTDAFATCP